MNVYIYIHTYVILYTNTHKTGNIMGCSGPFFPQCSDKQTAEPPAITAIGRAYGTFHFLDLRPWL